MPKSYIAVLDHEHLDNSVFLTSFARSLSQHGHRKGLVVHGDSPYTDRLIQTGMMREDARLRAIKDLNRRLIGLFADQGASAIGVHGYQKGLVKKDSTGVSINTDSLEQLHSTPHLLISSLVEEEKKTAYVPVPEFVKSISPSIEDTEIILFSRKEEDEILVDESETTLSWDDLPEGFEEETLPAEFQNFNFPVKMTTATAFSNWPNLEKVTKIR